MAKSVPMISVLLCTIFSLQTLRADSRLLGTGTLPGNGSDQSGLTDTLDGGFPHNRLGGISAIEYTGEGNRYVLLPDRGPADGATAYRCRYHLIDLTVEPGAKEPVHVTQVSTTLLRDEAGRNFVGAAAAIDRAHPDKTLRFDPEGVRLGRQHTLFISDEYGPYVYEFAPSGKRTRSLKIPPQFLAPHPAATLEEENAQNSSGRQPNGGMEGLAIAPDGSKLYAIMQRPLIQDSLPGKAGKRIGTNNRILEIHISTGATRELLYPLDETTNGVSEILAVNDHLYLVIERDGRAGLEARHKKIYKVDLAGATDISRIPALPVTDLPPQVTPAKKTLLIDLLESRFGLGGERAPEKVEGLAFGPTLPDGRSLLIVAIDNDFKEQNPILFYAFAIDQRDLVN